MWQRYYTVTSLNEAAEVLSEYGDRARVVAGATDLMLEIERGVRRGIEVVVDITRVPGLDMIRLDEQGWLRLGPLVTHNHCAGAKLIVERALPLAQACWQVGAPQIRNRATVAGNLITASPANDTIPPLMALQAVVTLHSLRGTRSLPLSEFYLGVRRTVMQPDEVLTEIAFPALPPEARGLFLKLALRRAQAISVVNVAAVLQFGPGTERLPGDQPVQAARLALGAVTPIIVRAAEAEAFLAGRALTPEVIREAGSLAQRAARPIDDVRSPAEYRREMVGVLTRRALRAIAQGQERDGLPAQPVMLWGALAGRPARPLERSTLHQAETPIVTRVNGREVSVSGAGGKSLLRLLREDLGLVGTKEGCAEGECGACTVFLDGAAVMSCMLPAVRAHGAEILTVEGLASPGRLHPLQQAFIDEGAVQCGYCTPGLLMSGAKLLEERPQPAPGEMTQAFTGNLCRCTGYYKILKAVERASRAAA